MALVPFPTDSSGAMKEPDSPEGGSDSGQHQKMSFLEHLDELRKRLTYSVIAVVVGVLIAFAFIDKLFTFIFLPLQQLLPNGEKLIYTEPTEAFTLYLELALLAGIVIAAPFIMWQVWLFIAPGLYSHEKKFAIPFVMLSSGGFIAGALFNHYIVFRLMWVFLASFSSDYVMFAPQARSDVRAVREDDDRHRSRLPDPDHRLFPGEDEPGNRPVPLEELQVRDPHHLHHRRRDHPERRSLHADGRRAADDRPVPDQHPARLGRQAGTQAR